MPRPAGRSARCWCPVPETNDPLIIAGRTFRSRLIVGTGKYPSHQIMRAAHEASGTDMVTVAVRRVDISRRSESLLDYIDTNRIFVLPNTAACYTADEAIRTAQLGREAGLSNWVKLEVIGDEQTLFPDTEALLVATRALVKDGFVVLPYTNDDPIVCRKLEDAGAAAVMPLGAPIGSGLGIQNPNNIRIIKAQARVPVIVDAGVGTASDATIAMELGVDGVLMNTAIAGAKDPVRMARGDAAGGRGRPAGVSRRAHHRAHVRVGQQPDRRTGRSLTRGPSPVDERPSARIEGGMSEPGLPKRTVSVEDLDRLKRQREASDSRYDEWLTAVDQALYALPEFPHPPPLPDEAQVSRLNATWDILRARPAAPAGWRQRAGGVRLGAARAGARQAAGVQLRARRSHQPQHPAAARERQGHRVDDHRRSAIRLPRW